MTTGSRVAPRPAPLTIGTDGSMAGASGSYRKHLGDLTGVYRDEAAYAAELERLGADHLVYTVEESRVSDGAGALVVGTSILLPGRVGDEYAVTRGHLHAVADRAELYHCLSGTGILLLDTVDGESEVYPMKAGDSLHVPGHWVHRSVNTGDEPFVSLFCYAADAGQDYGIIADAGGMATLVVTDGGGGWTTRPNPDHRAYAQR